MERLKPGRKPIEEKDKVKMCSAYLKQSEKQAINKKYESLTKAVRLLILPTLN
jgi:hypothetical protein